MQEIKLPPEQQQIFKKLLVAHNESHDAVYELVKNSDLNWREFNDLVGLIFEIRSSNHIDDYDFETLQKILAKIEVSDPFFSDFNNVSQEGICRRARESLTMSKKPSGRSM